MLNNVDNQASVYVDNFITQKNALILDSIYAFFYPFICILIPLFYMI